MASEKVLGKRKSEHTKSKRVSDRSLKRRAVLATELPWKEVKRPKEAGVDEFEGMLMLEEVDDVEIVFEQSANGRLAKFNVKAEEPQDAPDISDDEGSSSEDEWNGVQENSVADGSGIAEGSSKSTSSGAEEPAEDSNLLPEWQSFNLDPWLLRGLQARGFASPTPIQLQSLPFALKGRDVVGVAQTGSGKTLAFGLPILQHLLQTSNTSATQKRRLKALILAPTRELALQVSSHLNACLDPLMNSGGGISPPKVQDPKPSNTSNGSPPRVSVAAIVGGMSPQKQRRILDRGVDVLVATPGRLWDILGEDDDLATQIRQLRFLVLDEADRMIEQGHFQELDNILRLTLRLPSFPQESGDEVPEPAHTVEDGARDDLQTFIFSATLSKGLQRNLKKRRARPDKNSSTTLDELLLRLDFRDQNPEVIDISPAGGIVSSLKESKIECLVSHKDVYLYYFLLRYPGRSLVFMSSIDGIRRLSPLLDHLKIKSFPLHSQLEQRQRLKNLDRFKSCDNGVLLATDIAARGLDIPAVDHVIHYQVPRTADAYVHRNGRTARANNEGFALLMCAPEERKVTKALFLSLGRHENDIADLVVDHDILNKLKRRVQLAHEIDSLHHRLTKETHDHNWMKQTAEALDVIMDSDAEDSSVTDRRRKFNDSRTAALKAELGELLSKPVIARGVSTRYITSGTKTIADDLLAGNFHESMLGLDQSGAGSALTFARRPLNKPSSRKKSHSKSIDI